MTGKSTFTLLSQAVTGGLWAWRLIGDWRILWVQHPSQRALTVIP